MTAVAIQEPEKYTASELKNGIKGGRKLQTQLAKKLHVESGVEVSDYGCTLDDIKKISDHLKVQINVIDEEQFNELVYSTTNYDRKVYLHKSGNHFDVITSMPAFLCKDYYCHTCKKAYAHRDRHRCPDKCVACFRYFPDGKKCNGNPVECDKCFRTFFGNSCLENHLEPRGKGAETVRSSIFQCWKCG